MKSLYSQVNDLACDIQAEVDYGECFYEKKLLDRFLKKLDRMKELAVARYEENSTEAESEE